ncbi:hypothetical protein SAMN05660477_00413 [Soonwooa buanensis]|uniref:Uncharacterized protein n=1 Tax=Soonwooa buanensis TaxID=619805 RepID=A0A1T5CWA3_9FLAO|nr:hypothetical protein [Soonwooa buanensis]SKB63704.1 hypothetical protein SAMN05660477_00413 [Soonwooa buanensis]
MNLEITSTSITVQAREIVNDNTVNYAWNFIEGQLPQAINFNVQRGVSGGDNPFTGNNVISGAYYPDTGKYDVNNNYFTEGDFTLYQSILTTCKGIVTDVQNRG